MTDENPVYLKLSHSEAAGAKIDLLSTEMSLLNILKIAKRYEILREKELELKSDIKKSIKKLNMAMTKTKSVFPFINVPTNIRRKEKRLDEREPVKKETKFIPEENVDEGLESQLKDIQERLKAIGKY